MLFFKLIFQIVPNFQREISVMKNSVMKKKTVSPSLILDKQVI